MRLDNLVYDTTDFEMRIGFIPICKGADLEQIFETLVQRIHSTPAVLFPCVLAHEIGFDQDVLSFTSLKMGFGPAVQRWLWGLFGRFFNDRFTQREAVVRGNLNIAKQLNGDRFSTAANISIYPFSRRENSRSET